MKVDSIVVYQEASVPCFCMRKEQIARLRQAFPAARVTWCRSECACLRTLPHAQVVVTWAFRQAWFERAQRLRRTVANMPIEWLLLETDAPDQPDACCPGQRNAPARLAAIAECAARLRQTTPTALASLTSANARRLFNLPALEQAAV